MIGDHNPKASFAKDHRCASLAPQQVGGTSIMGLMMLAAAPGSVIRVEASGPEAEAALAALADLVEGLFGEED
jgi:phosphotransferase system HPr (HPr) family protein